MAERFARRIARLGILEQSKNNCQARDRDDPRSSTADGEGDRGHFRARAAARVGGGRSLRCVGILCHSALRVSANLRGTTVVGSPRSGGSRMQFINYYRCPRCAKDWTDEWDCMCDDDCPHCGCRHISPYRSEDAVSGDDVREDEPLAAGETVGTARDKLQISIVTKNLKLLADFGPDVVVVRIDL